MSEHLPATRNMPSAIADRVVLAASPFTGILVTFPSPKGFNAVPLSVDKLNPPEYQHKFIIDFIIYQSFFLLNKIFIKLIIFQSELSTQKSKYIYAAIPIYLIFLPIFIMF